jgi:hypothetical protein
MEVETAEIALEQRESVEEAPLPELMPRPEPALPAPASDQAPDQARPRGRPWVKGQSGNPAGRPLRIHAPAAVADYVIARKTVPLAKKFRDAALGGDKQMLKLWFQHQMALCRRAGPDWAALPMFQDRTELRAMRQALTEAAEKGAISSPQADALVRLVNTLLGML